MNFKVLLKVVLVFIISNVIWSEDRIYAQQEGINSQQVQGGGFLKWESGIIGRKVDTLLINMYGLYGGFTEDGTKISEVYVNKFKGLFWDGATIYNDLVIEKGGGKTESVDRIYAQHGNNISVDDYCNIVKRDYNLGLYVELGDLKKEEAVQKGKGYEIIIHGVKKILGYNSREGDVEKSYNILFIVGFEIEGNSPAENAEGHRHFGSFKIKEIRNEELVNIKSLMVEGTTNKEQVTAKNEERKLGERDYSLIIKDGSYSILEEATAVIEYNGRKQQKVSDIDGEVIFTDIPLDTWVEITVTKDNLEGTLSGKMGELKKNHKDIILEDISNGYSFNIKVIDSKTKETVSKCKVEYTIFEDNFDEIKETDSKGLVRFDSVPTDKEVGFYAVKDKNYESEILRGESWKLKRKGEKLTANNEEGLVLELKEKPVEYTKLTCKVIEIRGNGSTKKSEQKGKREKGISDLKVEVNNEGKIITEYTDDNGVVIFSDLAVGSEIRIIAGNENGKWKMVNEKITVEKDMEKEIRMIRIEMGEYITLNIKGLSTNINSEQSSEQGNYIKGWSESCKPGFEGEFIYSKNVYQTRKFEVSAGAGLSFCIYRTEFKADTVYNTYNTIDKDKETYLREVKAVNITEMQSISLLNIPLKGNINYLVNSKYLNKIYFNTGLLFSFILDNTYSVKNGNISYRGYYNGPEYKVVLYNLPEYDFYENQSAGAIHEIPLQFKNFGESYFLSAGLSFKLKDNIDLNVGGVLIFGLNSLITRNGNYIISRTPVDYNSLLSNSANIRLNTKGVQVGLTFKLK